MPRYKKDSKITLLGEQRLVNDVLKVLTKYPATKVVEFFKDLNLNFPRQLRIQTLKAIFRDEVFATRQERHNLADEMNYRLSWFNQFTEVQLVNLFKFYKQPELEQEFLDLLWLNILENITDRNISENSLLQIIKDAEEHTKNTPNTKEDIISYNKTLDLLFYDEKDHIDGLIQEQIRPVLYRSSTITEIRELGKKYGVNVPSRLKKSELIEIICQELKERNEYTEEIEADLNKMNIILIQRYAKNNDIKASTELKKEEVIEYILSNATETKEAYFVPSPTVYSVEEIEEPEMVEEVIEEPVVEEEPIVEEELVVEEEPVVEEKTIVVTEKQVSRKAFDITSVERTDLNIVEYHGQKAKEFAPITEYSDELEENKVTTKALDQKEETISKPKKNIFLRILFVLLTLVFFIAIVIILYALFTPNGVPSVDKHLGFLKTIIDFFRNLFH